MVDIASQSNELPRSLFLDGVELRSLHPIGYGAYADVFRGTYRGTAVALKRLRVNENEETWERGRKVRKSGVRLILYRKRRDSNSAKKASHGAN
jgi:hypothetical protein